MSNNHIYFAIHLPRLTDVHVEEDSYDEVEKMLEYFACTMLGLQHQDKSCAPMIFGDCGILKKNQIFEETTWIHPHLEH